VDAVTEQADELPRPEGREGAVEGKPDVGVTADQRPDIDLRPGGSYRWGLRKLPDGKPFWSTGTFIEAARAKVIWR